MTRPTFYIPDREQIQSLVLRDQEERARALREPTPEPAPVEETGVQVDPRKNRKQGPLLDLMDDVVSRTASVIGDAYQSWGQMSPEEQEEEQSLRRLQARQAEQTNAQLELQRAAENAEIAKALGEPDPTNNTYVGTNVPVQTMGDRNVAFLQEKAQGAPPTLTAARSASDAFLRTFAQAGLSVVQAPGIIVDSAEYAFTGDEQESAYVQALGDAATAVRKALPGDPTRNGELFEDLAGGGGSLTAILVGGGATKLLQGSAVLGSTIVGVTASGVSGYEDAKANNATTTAKYLSFYLNSTLGLSERVPISRALDRAFGQIDKASGGKVTEILVNGTVNSLEELIQELGQGIGQNKIAQILYDNERSIFEGVQDQATVGGILGFLLGSGSTALSQAMNRKPGEPVQPYTPPEPREIPPTADTPLDPGAFDSAQQELNDVTAGIDDPDTPPPPAAAPVSQAPAEPAQPVSPAPATQDAPLLETPAIPAPEATAPIPTTDEDQPTAEIKPAPTPATYAKWIDIYTKPRDTRNNERVVGADSHILAAINAIEARDEGVITPAQYETLQAVLEDTSKGVPESTRRFNNQMASMLMANRDGVAIQTGRASPVQEAAPAPAPTTPAPLPPALPDLPQQISDIVDGAPPPPRDQIPDASAASQTPATPGQSAGLFVFDPTKLQVDAQRFQFKEGGDQEGVTNRLKGVKRWDPAKANQVMVWQSKEGDLFVVDGHQRSGLARRLVEQGLEQKIELPGLLYRETDGFTPEKMRALAAGKNLAEGSGTLLDAAKVLKVDPTLIDESMPVSDYKIRQATDLAKLGDEPLRMVINEVTEPEYGAIVGRFIPDNTEQQIAAISALNKVGPANAVEAELIVRRVVNSQMVAAGDQAQGGLFGDELDMPESTVVEEIKIVAKAMAELKKDKAVFARVVKNADKIESVGSRINREASEGIVSESDRALILLASQSDTAGPVRTQLLELAKDLKQGKITSTAAARKLAQTIRSQPAFKTRGDDTIPDIAAMRARRRAPIDQGTMDLFAQGQEIAAAEAAQNVRRKAEQLTLEGMEQSARQLAAAREAGARGRMTSAREQANADQGLFAEKPDDGGFDFMKPSSIKAPSPGDRPLVVSNMPKRVWDNLKRDIKKSQPLPNNFDNVEEVRASLASLQEELAQAAAEIAAELGINFKARSQVKTEKSILKKKAAKNLESIQELTDLVGAGFQPTDMAQAEIIVERLSVRFGVIDEGWIVTETGYFDRKVMIRFPNGVAGEIQMWPPGILEAKEDGIEFEGEFIVGHDLYEQIKETKSPEASRALYAKSVRFYSSIASGLSSSFQELFFNSFNASSGLADANADLNSASGISETLRGSSNQTAEGSTSTQAPDMASRAALAFEPSFTKTVGSPSQLMNDVVATGTSNNTNTDASTTIDNQNPGNVNAAIPGQPGSATTQVATTGGSYARAAQLIMRALSGANTILDYGAGMGLGTDAMRNTSGIQVDSYEPFPQRWQGSQPPTFTNSNAIRQTYDGVVSLNVLNVLEPKLRDVVAKDIISKLAPGGVAVIGTRKFKGDVDQAKKAERADEPGAIWIKKGDQRVYQKGFDGDELVTYLETIVPEGYTVERGSGIAANTAIVRAPDVEALIARNDPTNTPEFKTWFGDSKVVDENGKPLAVYRGEFGETQTGDLQSRLPSLTFGELDAANLYAGGDPYKIRKGYTGPEAPRVVKAYLSLQNPIINTPNDPYIDASRLVELFGADKADEIVRSFAPWFEDTNNWVDEINGEEEYTGVGDFLDRHPERIGELYAYIFPLLDDANFIALAKEAGYDGAIYGGVGSTAGQKEWRVFSQNQVKSVFNRGTFDPNDPNIDQMVARQAGVSLSGEPQRPAAGIPDTGGEQKKIALSAMSDNFVRLLNLTFRSGRMTRSRDALAQYNRKTGVIRARQRNDFSTLVHEGGHALHDGRSAEIDAMVQTHQNEMSQVALRHYGAPQNLNQAQLLREGFAEFFRFYVTNPQLARQEAPKFFQDFDTFLKTSDPNLHKGLAALQSQVAYYTQQYPSTDVVKSFVKSAKQKNLWDPRDLTEVVAEESQNARPYEDKPTVGGFFDWLRRGFFDQTSRVYTAAVDQNNGMRKLTYGLLNAAQRNNKTIDLKDVDNPLELLSKASNSFMPAQLALQYGVRQYKTANPVGPGLRDGIAVMMGSSQGAAYFNMNEQRMADANAYLVALRAVEEYQRYAAGEIQNPPVGFTEADAKQAVRDFEAKYGQAFIDGARMVHRYARNLLDREFEAGLITQETYDLIKDKQNYVPLLRDMSDKNKEFGQNALTSGKTSLIKRFRGSSRDIIAPLDALMHRTFATEKRIAENDTIKALASLAEKAGAGAGALVEKIPAAEVERIQVQMNDVLSKILNDPSISPADAAIMDGIFQASFGGDETMSLFRSTMLNERGERILTYRDNGELRAIQLGDDGVGESVFNVMRGLGNDKVPLLLEVLSAPSRALRFGITRWPDFLLINYFRDQWNAGVATNVGYIPMLTGAKGMYDVVRRKKAFLDYSDAMGIMGGVAEYQIHKARVRQDIEGLKQKGYAIETFEFDGFNYRSLAGLVKGVFRLTELAEAGTRVGLFSKAYKRAIREGLTEYDAIQEASRIARDYMDFGRAGSKMAAANRLIPFLNANIQGLDVTIRKLGGGGATGRKALAFMDENRAAPRLQAFVKTITAVTESQRKDLKLSRVELNDLKNAQAMWVKMTGLALMSAAITYAFKDDEDYQETSEYLRQTGWIIPLGDGRIFYAPKPFEVALLGNFMERAIEYAYGDEAALDKFWNNFVNAVSPPMIPPIASQAFGLGANIDISFGKPREIVPSYMERLPPEQRYHATTTELAKKIGAAIDYPPAKIDFLITSLFGSMGRDVSGALDGMLNPERAEKGVDDSFITRRFIRDATRGGMASQDFTELSNRLNGSLTQASSGYKRFVDVGDAQGAAQYLASLTQDERAWAVLDRDFDAKFKRLHPIYRAGQISTIVSGMRREILSAKLKDSDNEGEFILLTAKEKRLVDDFLTDYQRRERRNALISFEHPGWKNKKPIDTAPSLDLLREASPAVADELERRLGKAKVYDGGEVAANWPELRKRLLDEGSEAILSDLLP